MSQLELVKNRTLEKLLYLLGFEKIHQKGNHAFYKHKDGRTTSLPCHRDTKIVPSLLREILREIQIGFDTYNDFLSEARGEKSEVRYKR